jgi:hypothetical protein
LAGKEKGKGRERNGKKKEKGREKKKKKKRGIEKGRGRFIQRCGIIAIDFSYTLISHLEKLVLSGGNTLLTSLPTTGKTII